MNCCLNDNNYLLGTLKIHSKQYIDYIFNVMQERQCLHWIECTPSTSLQCYNIRRMADLSQNLDSFASNTTEHLEGVPNLDLIPSNYMVLQNRWGGISLFLEFINCYGSCIFSQFSFHLMNCKYTCEKHSGLTCW